MFLYSLLNLICCEGSGGTSGAGLILAKDSGSVVHLSALVVFNQNGGGDTGTAECCNLEIVVSWNES